MIGVASARFGARRLVSVWVPEQERPRAERLDHAPTSHPLRGGGWLAVLVRVCRHRSTGVRARFRAPVGRGCEVVWAAVLSPGHRLVTTSKLVFYLARCT